jgi:hypothetical protein
VTDDDPDECGDIERIINVPSAGSVNRVHDRNLVEKNRIIYRRILLNSREIQLRQ